MSIARQFYLLVCVAPILAIAFAIGLTYQFADLSARGSHLVNNLQRTATISQELARGHAEESELLSAQVRTIDPSFPERIRRIDYELGERSTEYLKLDIGGRERLTVERIKALQSELSVVAMQVYHDLQSTPDRRDAVDLSRARRLESQVRDEFETLSALQLTTLGEVLAHVDRTSVQAAYAVVALVLTVLFAAGATAVVVRRRILRPVAAILHASNRMRLGDLGARAPGGRSDEIGQLTQGFNFMAEALAESHAELERKVEQRTAQLKEVEGQLVQAEKLSAVGLLVGGVAHELNNPLAAITGFTELAKMEAAGRPGGDACLQRLEQIEVQAERCRRIVGNLLQFARKQEPRMEAFALNPAVDQMLELRGYELATRNTRVVREFDPANPVLWADRDKIQQVVLNLLNNAADAITERGATGTIVVRTRAEEAHVAIEFLDDGTGFREPSRVFDPFYTTKEVGKGTGLGLSVCYGIVQEHGGEIVAANWEKGARVTVRLPLREESAPLPAVAADAVAGQMSAEAEPAVRRVLVVDDEPSLLRLQAAFLERMGVDSETAQSGEEAIRYLEGHEVDVVVSDVRMPGAVDGVQLYEWVRANRPQLAGRFIFVSGDLLGLNLGGFFARTGAARIGKPFRFDAYSRAILQAMGRKGTQR